MDADFPASDRASREQLPCLAYGVDDAAKAIGISRSRLYELISAGEIAVCKVGKRTIIPTVELTALLERHRVERLTGDVATPPGKSSL